MLQTKVQAMRKHAQCAQMSFAIQKPWASVPESLHGMDKNPKMVSCNMGHITKEEFDSWEKMLENTNHFEGGIQKLTDAVASIPETASIARESPSPQLLICGSRDECTTPIELGEKELALLDAFNESAHHQLNEFKSIGTNLIRDFHSISPCRDKPGRTKGIHSPTRNAFQCPLLLPLLDCTRSGCNAHKDSNSCESPIWNKVSQTSSKAAPPPTRQQFSQDNARQPVPTSQVADPTLSAFVVHQPKASPTKRHSSTAQNDGAPPTKRQRHLESPEQTPRVIDCKYFQFLDCKTKTASTETRHEDLPSNILSNSTDKYYRPLQIVLLKNGRRQLQTPCFCDRTRTFSLRRSVRKGVAITFFKADKCTCGHAKAHQLLMCFCGALFRATKSLYVCPCFNQQGPAFAMFPNYSEFAARGCPCPVKTQRRCRCISTAPL